MDHRYTVCVILCLFTTAVAFSETDNAQWRTHMEERMEEMLQMIQRQNEVIEKQTNTIEKQSGEIELLRHRVKTLEGRTDNSETSNEKSTDLSTGNATAATSIERELHSEVSKTPFILRRLAPDDAPYPVAFYAYISHNFGGVGTHQVFLYDTIVTNQGNGYSKHTGAFTAPSPGVYAFCYTAFASGEHVAGETGQYGEVGVQLLHNGAYKGSIYIDTESNYEEDMSTGFAILMLQAGDVVLTMSVDAGQGSFQSNYYGRWSFSGFQIS
uniref:C1q domain-containing protein n=1 Tax=Magallana gigas TaxID=29159 RepID=A0A8W8MDH3_MAGGI|nr:collagen alpha-2(VIII) chain-like [Crassostrea gigas]